MPIFSCFHSNTSGNYVLKNLSPYLFWTHRFDYEIQRRNQCRVWSALILGGTTLAISLLFTTDINIFCFNDIYSQILTDLLFISIISGSCIACVAFLRLYMKPVKGRYQYIHPTDPWGLDSVINGEIEYANKQINRLNKPIKKLRKSANNPTICQSLREKYEIKIQKYEEIQNALRQYSSVILNQYKCYIASYQHLGVKEICLFDGLITENIGLYINMLQATINTMSRQTSKVHHLLRISSSLTVISIICVILCGILYGDSSMLLNQTVGLNQT